MLIPNIIPNKEPLLRAGIILPEDKQSQVNLHADGRVSILADNKRYTSDALNLGIRTDGNKLSFFHSGMQLIAETLDIESEDEFKTMDVWPVVAGRGFHWCKNIAVKLTSRLEIRVVDGYILLINELPLEQYLACVATSEMSAACPEEMIEAQTIVARSWMLANVEKKHVHLGFDVCNDDCCQRFQGMAHLTGHARLAAEKTKGLVLMHAGKICDARYSKSCGGVMEKFENLWAGENLPYMQNIVDSKTLSTPDLTDEDQFIRWIHSRPETFCSDHFIHHTELKQYLGNVDESGAYFRWKIEITQEELTRHINQKLLINAQAIRNMKTLSRGGSGRMLELQICYIDENGDEQTRLVHRDYHIRDVLHPMFLYSSACQIGSDAHQKEIPSVFSYTGGGWGHGAGLCQIGALGMALHGYKTSEILEHYYPGSKSVLIY